MGVCVPEEYGGAGADFLSYVLVLEELSRADAGVGVTVAVHTSATTLPILAFGTDEQRERFVPPLARASGSARSRSPSPAPAPTRAPCERLPFRTATGGCSTVPSSGSRTDHAPARSCSSRAPTRRRRARAACRASSSTPTTCASRARRRSSASTRRRPRTSSSRTPGRPRSPPARGGPRIPCRDGDARRRPDRDRGAGGRHRPGGVRRRAQLRAGARAVRSSHRRLPGDPVEARGHGDRARRCAPAHLPRRLAQARGSAARSRGREGEAVRLGDGETADGRGDPDPRRLRLHEGVPGRAVLPRREDHGDLRGYERDPATRHRAVAPRAAAAARVGGRLPQA